MPPMHGGVHPAAAASRPDMKFVPVKSLEQQGHPGVMHAQLDPCSLSNRRKCWQTPCVPSQFGDRVWSDGSERYRQARGINGSRPRGYGWRDVPTVRSTAGISSDCCWTSAKALTESIVTFEALRSSLTRIRHDETARRTLANDPEHPARSPRP